MLVTGVVALTALATACSSSTPGDTGTSSGPGATGGQEAPQASGDLTIWVGSWWESQVEPITTAWKADHPEINLSFELLSNDGYLDKFTSAALGGNPPDIVDLDATVISTAAGAGLLQPLDEWTADLPEDDFNPAIWAASHFDGKSYAYPTRGESEVLYYNKTVFDRAGVEYPQPGWTYDDLKETAAKLTIPGQQSGMGLAADPSDGANVLSSFAPVLWSFGGDFLNEDNTAAAINTPESVEGITFWTDFYTKDHTAPDGTPAFTTTRDLIPLFEADQLGMMVQASNTFQTLVKNPDLQWGVVPEPDGGLNRGGGWAMAVPVGAKNPDAARVFLDWFIQPEHLGTLMNRMPARISARDVAPWDDPMYDTFKDVTPASKSVPSVASWAQMQTAIIAELQKILTGQATPQQGADAMAAAIDDILAKQ